VFSGANMAVAIAVLSIVLGVLVVLRPDVTRVRDGRVLAFLALFLLPSMAVWAGVSQHMDRAKTTEFCLSCHTMEDYGRSLYVGRPELSPCRTLSKQSRSAGSRLLYLPHETTRCSVV
jgi:hypothetical protein